MMLLRLEKCTPLEIKTNYPTATNWLVCLSVWDGKEVLLSGLRKESQHWMAFCQWLILCIPLMQPILSWEDECIWNTLTICGRKHIAGFNQFQTRQTTLSNKTFNLTRIMIHTCPKRDTLNHFKSHPIPLIRHLSSTVSLNQSINPTRPAGN